MCGDQHYDRLWPGASSSPSSNGPDADTKSGYAEFSKKAEENHARVKEGLRNALEQQRTDGTGKKKRDISMGALERTFKAEVTASRVDRREYARAVEAAGGNRRRMIVPTKQAGLHQLFL